MNTTTNEAATNNTPKIGSMWLGQNQRAYKVTAIANTDGSPSLTPVTVIYENSTGVFTRPLRSWHGSMTAQVV